MKQEALRFIAKVELCVWSLSSTAPSFFSCCVCLLLSWVYGIGVNMFHKEENTKKKMCVFILLQ